MTADRNAPGDQKLDGRREPGAAFELHHLRPGSHQPRRVAIGLLASRLVAAERHVGDDERGARTGRDTARVINHVVERDRQRRAVAADHHAKRIADEKRVHARAIEHGGEARVVAGKHRDLLA